jgi:hypothetical protein
MHLDTQKQYSLDKFQSFVDFVMFKSMPYAFNGGLSHNHNWDLLFFSSYNVCTCCTKLTKPLEGNYKLKCP